LRRIGLRQHFRVPPWTDFVEVYWRHGTQAYVTPVAADEVCVAVLGSTRGGRLADLTWFPELAKRLGNANRVGPARGAISMSTRLAKVTRNPFALIGDASGAVDAVTGEGLSLALRQALALGQALATGDLDVYENAHRRMTRLPLLAARVLVHLGAHDAWRWRVLETLAAHPSTFERLLAVHVGAAGLATGAHGIAGLALRLIQPKRSPPLACAIASSSAPADLWRSSR
jgi:flavin-dependent dehydrogenase